MGVVVKREPSQKATPWIYQSIYILTLTYGHELWVVTERMRSWTQATGMTLPRRVAGLCLRDRDIRSELGVKPLLLSSNAASRGGSSDKDASY